MTNNTKLIVSRVVIKKDNVSVYDQNFHVGINVIRGDNSTGKSTVMDLISYGLGADIKKQHWKQEALSCDEIFIEVSLNGLVHVFKREIQEAGSKPPIHMKQGQYDDSIQSFDGWTVYGYMKLENKVSFATRIFDLLGFEDHITDDNSRLTMHQIFRLLYADQDTPASNIFRWESVNYDRESMRVAIGEYLFGFDNLDAHILRQKLISLNKAFDKLNEDLLAVYKILGKTNINANTKKITEDINKLIENLIYLENKRILIKSDSVKSSSVDLTEEAKQINKKIESLSLMLVKYEQDVVSISYDINESEEFLKSLEQRKHALKNSQVTVNSLGMVDFDYCPSCLTKLSSLSENHTNCQLCKNTVDQQKINESYLQAIDQIDFQYRESAQLIEHNKSERSKFIALSNQALDELNSLKIRFREINSFSDDYELNLTKIAIERGSIESRIQALKDRLMLAAELDRSIEEKGILQMEIDNARLNLEGIEASREARKKSVLYRLSSLVVEILSKDTGSEKAFISANKFDIDFGQNIMLLDDRANFSASSNVVLKNAFHLAVLIIACADDNFRLPCFTMMDNIEDKGMTEERSRNFQKLIVEFCSRITTEYQLIMTTSMVDDLLNTNEYCVGPFYSKGQYTLAI